MKTEMMGTKRPGLFSKGVLTALIALPLGLVASCAEPDQTNNDEQALTGDCTLKHPYSWTVGGHTCRESNRSGTQIVSNGDTVEMEATHTQTSGEGMAIVGCVNGVIVKSGTVNGQPLSQTCQ